jgi:hypothetical protein
MTTNPTTTTTTTTKTHLVLRVRDQDRYIRLCGSSVDAITEHRTPGPHDDAWAEWHNRPGIPRFDSSLDAWQRDGIMHLAQDMMDQLVKVFELDLNEFNDLVDRYDRALQAIKDGYGPPHANPPMRYSRIHVGLTDDISAWVNPSAWTSEQLGELRSTVQDSIKDLRAEMRTTRRELDRLNDARQRGLEWMTVSIDTTVVTTILPV